MDDLRLAFRTLRRAPAYALTVILTLALGIGGATAVYSVLHSVILRPLPYAPADRVMLPGRARLGRQHPASVVSHLPGLDHRHRRVRGDGLRARAQHRDEDRRGRRSGWSARSCRTGSSGCFPSRPPSAARSSRPTTRLGRRSSSVLSWRLWQRGFGGDRAALGRSVTLGDRAYTVVGVMPAGFAYPTWADFYAPIAAIRSTDAALGQRGLHVDSRVDRPAPGGSGLGRRPAGAFRGRRTPRRGLPGGERRLARRGTAPGRVRSPG